MVKRVVRFPDKYPRVRRSSTLDILVAGIQTIKKEGHTVTG